MLGTAKTDAAGAFSLRLKVPRDFGGIHDVYAVVDGVQQAKGGFLIERTLQVSPLRGPIGTPITIKIAGLGSTLYGGAASVWWDGRYTGVVTGKWTRGEATVHIRAAGPVGKHVLLVGTGMQFNYLNIQQSPIPWALGAMKTFTVTRDGGVPKMRVERPLAVKPTVEAKTTMSALAVAPNAKATVTLDTTRGAVNTRVAVRATGLAPNQPVTLDWATVAGNRVNCTGTCWSFVTQPLGGGTAAADGTLTANFTVPDGLGGWHVVRVLQGTDVKTQIAYFVERSFVEMPKVVRGMDSRSRST